MRLDEHPLQLFYRFLREIGHTSARRMQLIGMKEDLAPLFKFVGGKVHNISIVLVTIILIGSTYACASGKDVFGLCMSI